jgi:hypothetical protein
MKSHSKKTFIHKFLQPTPSIFPRSEIILMSHDKKIFFIRIKVSFCSLCIKKLYLFARNHKVYSQLIFQVKVNLRSWKKLKGFINISIKHTHTTWDMWQRKATVSLEIGKRGNKFHFILLAFVSCFQACQRVMRVRPLKMIGRGK